MISLEIPCLKKISQKKTQNLLWLYAIFFFLLFIVIARLNIGMQKKPNFNYQILPTGQWQISDNSHPTMVKDTVITAIMIDKKQHRLTVDWLKESFYQIGSRQQQQQVFANEKLLFEASKTHQPSHQNSQKGAFKPSAMTLIDAQGQSHGFKLSGLQWTDVSLYTLALYGLGWLKFIIGFITARVGKFDANKLIFLLATSTIAFSCFYSISTFHRVWAVDPFVLSRRLLTVSLWARLYFFALVVIWLRVPNNLFLLYKPLKIWCSALLATLIGTWGIYYFTEFVKISLSYEELMLFPAFLAVLLGYFVLYLQWRIVHNAPFRATYHDGFTSCNSEATASLGAIQSNEINGLEHLAEQRGYRVSQSLALRWTVILIVMAGLSGLMFNLLMQTEIIDGDRSIALFFITTTITSLGVSTLILHEHLYKVQRLWWRIWGVSVACSLGGATNILLSASPLGLSFISVLVSSIVGLLGYFSVFYYFQVRYAKTEAKLLTIAIPKLMTINSKSLTVNDMNNIWQDILASVFQPKYIEILSNGAFLSSLDDRYVSQVCDAHLTDIGLISNAGETMVIQAVDNKIFVLHYASNGLNLFNSDNLKKAQLLWRMVKQAHGLTMAYRDGETTERKRIAYDLHDDIGGKLLHLSSQDGEYGKYAGKTLQDLRTLTHALSNETQTLVLIIADARYQIHNYCDHADIELIFCSDINEDVADKLISAQASVNLTCILNELTRNALQNPSTTTLKINLTVSNTNCLLFVENDGENTNPNEWERGLGTVSSERRVNQLAGSINWKSKNEGGVICQVEFHLSELYRKAF